ncbi:YcgN family cysteine cluster protein [Hellea balneolensis]|uniref:YcgN family cysteine cluster protein n=1 Tax=Hellea balneolensis TaxID=287478 RepID=UPI0004236D92|nr:YcgN family cysteine cluster protein [Hellea balneolensis]
MPNKTNKQLNAQLPFWKTKNMAEMSPSEWESLCDNCGKCCCIRLEDDVTGDIYITDVACKLFDPATCRCTDYANRSKKVPDCVTLTKDNVDQLHWMPQTCAYRLVAEGKDLPEYHHLVSGSRKAIHEVGMSVQDAVTSEVFVSEDEQATRIVIWPGEPDIG